MICSFVSLLDFLSGNLAERQALRGLFLFVSIRYQAFHILLFYKPLSVPFYTILPKRQTYIWVLFRVLDF